MSIKRNEGKWPVEKVARETRLNRREQVNRLKRQSDEIRSRVTVRLYGLKACRLAAGLSQRELARMIGTNQWTIAELEKERGRGAYIVTIRRLCRALRVMPADLICKEPVE